MNLEALIAQFRTDADDRTTPYLWSDAAVTAWLNDAVKEAAIRGRLLHESGNAAICQIAVTADVSTYPIHTALYEIDYLAYQSTTDTRRQHVWLVSREEVDAIHPDWRERTGPVEFAIQSDATIRLSPTPATAGTLFLEGFRLPLNVLASDGDTPEINQAHHVKLIHWALHRAFSVPDSETVDPTRAGMAEAAFTAYFGIAPDSDLRRATRQDVQHHNQAW